jgi:hypothetical protein
MLRISGSSSATTIDFAMDLPS